MELLKTIKTIYREMPPWSTAWLRSVPNAVLFGKGYRGATPSISQNEMRLNLKKALDFSRAHTLWGRENIPEDIVLDEVEDVIKTLPTVTSAELAANPQRFLSDTASASNSYWTTTGGSGRNPTSICLSNASFGREWKHMHAIWGSSYSRHCDLKLTFRGYSFKPGELIRFDPIYNELSVDSFQVTDKNFGTFLKKLRKYRVSCLHGYPSLITLFMERLRRASETFDVKLVFLSSEGATPELKHQLSEFFHAQVISWYGLTEKVVLAYDADQSGRFINFSSYGHLWISHPDENGVGEIIGTTFVNEAMPLVNYRTGDYGRVQYERNADGIEVAVLDCLQGRSGKDFLYLTKQDRVSMTAINLHSEIQSKIVFYQIVQKEYGRISVNILLKETAGGGGYILAEFERILREKLKGFEVECRNVKNDSEFVRSTRGKLLMLVQYCEEGKSK